MSIKTEFSKNNQWITAIDHIYKFPNKNILKIQFTNTQTAKKAIDNGILEFHMSIPDHKIKPEEYIPITTCMHCKKEKTL